MGGGEGLRGLLRLLGTLTSDAGASLTRSKRIRVRSHEVHPAEIRRLATLIRNEAVAARRKPERPTKVISLPTGLQGEAIAVWSTCWTGGDPFTVPAGSSFPISLGLDAFVPGTPSALLNISLDGQAKVLKRGPSTLQSDSVTLRITAVLSGDPVNLSKVRVPNASRRFDVSLQRDEAGQTLVRLSGAQAEEGQPWQATLTWSGTTIQADGELRETPEPDTRVRRLAAGHARQDPGVNQPGQQYHDLAVQALTIMQGAKLDEPSFLDNAMQALFPTGGKTRVEVQPTTDWVLFRRRRSEHCDDTLTAPPAPARSPTSCVRADNEDDAQAIAAALREGSEEINWTAVDIVEFTAGTASLQTFPSIVQQDYQDAGGAAHLALVGYGTTIAGDPTGIGRARALVEALTPGVTLDDDNVDLLTDPPAGQMLPGTEASVFFVSYERAPAVKDCVEVINVDEVERGEGPRLLQAITTADVAAVAGLATLVEPLGAVPFTASGPGQSELEAVAGKLKEIAEQHWQEDPRVPFAIGWVAADLTTDQSVGKQGQLKALAEQYQLELSSVVSAGLPHDDHCGARLYVLQHRPAVP